MREINRWDIAYKATFRFRRNNEPGYLHWNYAFNPLGANSSIRYSRLCRWWELENHLCSASHCSFDLNRAFPNHSEMGTNRVFNCKRQRRRCKSSFKEGIQVWKRGANRILLRHPKKCNRYVIEFYQAWGCLPNTEVPYCFDSMLHDILVCASIRCQCHQCICDSAFNQSWREDRWWIPNKAIDWDLHCRCCKFLLGSRCSIHAQHVWT